MIFTFLMKVRSTFSIISGFIMKTFIFFNHFITFLILIFKYAYSKVINGKIILKKQNGINVIGSKPNVAEWYAEHVFQGTRTDVTVPLSSNVLLKFSGAKPLSLYILEYIFPGTTIDKY